MYIIINIYLMYIHYYVYYIIYHSIYLVLYVTLFLASKCYNSQRNVKLKGFYWLAFTYFWLPPIHVSLSGLWDIIHHFQSLRSMWGLYVLRGREDLREEID